MLQYMLSCCNVPPEIAVADGTGVEEEYGREKGKDKYFFYQSSGNFDFVHFPAIIFLLQLCTYYKQRGDGSSVAPSASDGTYVVEVM